jgi:hypothetical protein
MQSGDKAQRRRYSSLQIDTQLREKTMQQGQNQTMLQGLQKRVNPYSLKLQSLAVSLVKLPRDLFQIQE